jgi:hypothetical protein
VTVLTVVLLLSPLVVAVLACNVWLEAGRAARPGELRTRLRRGVPHLGSGVGPPAAVAHLPPTEAQMSNPQCG